MLRYSLCGNDDSLRYSGDASYKIPQLRLRSTFTAEELIGFQEDVATMTQALLITLLASFTHQAYH